MRLKSHLALTALFAALHGVDAKAQVQTVSHSGTQVFLRVSAANNTADWQNDVRSFVEQAVKFRILQVAKAAVVVDPNTSCGRRLGGVVQSGTPAGVMSTAYYDVTVKLTANPDSSFLADVHGLRCQDAVG